MKSFTNCLKNNRGSELIEAMGAVLVLFTVLAFGLTFIPCFIEGQKLLSFTASIVRTAEVAGSTDIQPRIDRLIYDTNISPDSINWSGTQYHDALSRVQLNDKIVVEVKSSYDLKLFGFTTLEIPLTSRASGASEVYYK